MIFGWFLIDFGRFWMDFWRNFQCFLLHFFDGFFDDPSWFKLIFDGIFRLFGWDFDAFLMKILGWRCVHVCAIFNSWVQLEAQESGELILIDFGLIFDVFWLIFRSFLNDFSMIWLSPVLDIAGHRECSEFSSVCQPLHDFPMTSVMVVILVWYRCASWMF